MLSSFKTWRFSGAEQHCGSMRSSADCQELTCSSAWLHRTGVDHLKLMNHPLLIDLILATINIDYFSVRIPRWGTLSCVTGDIWCTYFLACGGDSYFSVVCKDSFFFFTAGRWEDNHYRTGWATLRFVCIANLQKQVLQLKNVCVSLD